MRWLATAPEQYASSHPILHRSGQRGVPPPKLTIGSRSHYQSAPYGTAVVLTTIWVELVNDPKLVSWRLVKSRDHRVLSIVAAFVGGLWAAAMAHTRIGATGAFAVAAGVRIISAASFLMVPAAKREAKAK